MDAERQRVLVFPAGSEIGLEIFRSLSYSHHVEVFGASGRSDHASYVYDREHYFEDPGFYVDAPGFLERFNALLRRLDIRFIYPTHDTVACFLAANQHQLAAHLVSSGAETNHIARHKSLTYGMFAGEKFGLRTYASIAEVDHFPVFLKPDDGQGGKGSFRADDTEEAAFYLGRHPHLLITEFLPGEELSVDCFTDFQGKLLFVGPRTRERVQMGISFRTTARDPDPDILAIAQALNDRLQLDGAWFFQVRRDAAGQWKLLEFAPRQSSTMGLYRHAGVNFALLSLFNAMRVAVTIQANQYGLQLDRCLQNRFRADLDYRRVYIDLDETIIVQSHVHGRVMDYLYQCRNRGIELFLITKHRHDLAATLRGCGISEHLFTRILHLREDEDKADRIDPEGAIFIDNYWHDRLAVARRHGIPVFDADAIECLMN